MLFAALDRIDSYTRITEVIHGAYRGADTLANEWALQRKRKPNPFPAAWDIHGTAAGPIRNKQMLVEGKPELVVAFPGRHGTKDMKIQADNAGIRVIEIEGSGDEIYYRDYTRHPSGNC